VNQRLLPGIFVECVLFQHFFKLYSLHTSIYYLCERGSYFNKVTATILYALYLLLLLLGAGAPKLASLLALWRPARLIQMTHNFGLVILWLWHTLLLCGHSVRTSWIKGKRQDREQLLMEGKKRQTWVLEKKHVTNSLGKFTANKLELEQCKKICRLTI